MIPSVWSSSFSACRPSFDVLIVNEPSQIRILSLASMASFAHVISYVPPVVLISSLPEIPLPFEDLITRVPVPFKTRSSFEKITASVLVVPSAVNVPVTERVEVLPFVVTKHLSAFTT